MDTTQVSINERSKVHCCGGSNTRETKQRSLVECKYAIKRKSCLSEFLDHLVICVERELIAKAQVWSG